MSQWDLLYGNERLKKILSADFASSSFPHAVILEGGQGSGKTMLAHILSQALACKEENAPCGECRLCDLIARDLCPDVFYTDVPEDKKFITVEQIREIREKAFIKPNDCDVKVFVIRNAHRLNVQTQNMLLKILEEPPAETFFLLLCENALSLLPTVRSRAPIFKMQHFEENELDAFLSSRPEFSGVKANSPEFYAYALKNSNGCIGQAMKLLSAKEGKESEAHQKANDLIGLLTSGRRIDRSELLLFLQNVASDREGFSAFCSEFSKALRDLLSLKKGGQTGLMFFPEEENAREKAYELPAQSLVRLLAETMRFSSLSEETNSNLTLTKSVFADAVFGAL